MSFPRNKYNAKPTKYNGRTYDSKAEAKYAEGLDLAVRAGTVAYWIPQPLVWLGPLEYRPDFLVVENVMFGPSIVYSRRNVFVDIKGVETQRFRDVRKMWAEFGPDDLRVVKGNLVETIKGRVAPAGEGVPSCRS